MRLFERMPSKTYWLKELNIVVLLTEIPIPPSDYWGPKTATKIIFYNADTKQLRKMITDFVIFSNFLNMYHSLLEWMFNKSFVDFERYGKDINTITEYVQETAKKQDWHFAANYEEYPLYEITPNPTKIDFQEYFVKYVNLSSSEPNVEKTDHLTTSGQFWLIN